MDNAQNSNIKTQHPHNNEGITIKEGLYHELVDFIVTNLRTNTKVSSPVLMTRAVRKFSNIRDIQNYINYVQLDLEAKGLIKLVAVASINVVWIQLTSLGLRLFEV